MIAFITRAGRETRRSLHESHGSGQEAVSLVEGPHVIVAPCNFNDSGSCAHLLHPFHRPPHQFVTNALFSDRRLYEDRIHLPDPIAVNGTDAITDVFATAYPCQVDP